MASNAITITVPKEYGYVILTTTAAFLLASWHGVRTTPFRKAAKVPYPIPYAFGEFASTPSSSADPATKEKQAKDVYLFNCAQRAHGNYLENLPTVAATLLIAGLKFPVASSLLGVGWGFFRVLYARGYTRADKSDGSGRLDGRWWPVFQLGLLGLSFWTGASLVLA